MIIRTTRRSLLAWHIAAVLAPCAAAAQDGAYGEDFLGLDAVVITASRLDERSLGATSIVNVLDGQTLQLERQARTLPEALREVPGVMVQKTGHGQGSPFIRGFTGFRNVLLVDGVRLNNSVFREGPNQYWATVDPFALDRLEVVKGSGSVLYGSDAIGGVVNTVSSLAGLGHSGWSGRLLYRRADAEHSDTERGEASFGGERLRARAGVSVKDYGDLEVAGLGVLPHTGYEEHDADARLEYDLSDATTLVAAHQYTTVDDAWRTHRTVYAKSWQGTSVGSDRVLSFDQRRNLSYVQIRHRGLGAFADALTASVSYQKQEEDQFRLRSDLRMELQGFDVGTTGVWLQLEKATRIGQWVYGFDYYVDEVDSWRTDLNADGSLRAIGIQGPVGDDASYELGGLFVQDRIAFGPRFDLTLGLRETFAAADAGRVQSPITGQPMRLEDDWDNLVGSVRFSFRPGVSGDWALFGGVSQGFRAPNLSDLTRLDIARSGELETPVLGLDPERFVAWELGAKVQRPRWSAQAAAFYTDVRGMIVRAPTGDRIGSNSQVTKRNAGDGFLRGVEAQLAFQLTRSWRAQLSGFWLDAEVDQFPSSQPLAVAEPLDLLMPATVTAGLRWRAPGGRLQIESVLLHAEAQDELSTRDRLDTQRVPPGGTPGYTVLHLRSRWLLTPQMSLSFAIDNVTDREYRIHGSGLNEAGRNLIASLNWAPGAAARE